MIKEINQLRKNELGFTLIEVMVVIIMVGILAAIAVPIYTNYVHRARVSEAISTLGAVKTYLMERRNATGSWPTQIEMNSEFRQFSDLYYFNAPALTPSSGGSGNTITVTITPDKTNFDVPDDYTGNLRLIIDWANADNSGWDGDIREDWASHLPKAGA